MIRVWYMRGKILLARLDAVEKELAQKRSAKK
jgi:hypothetical protein